MSSDLIIFVVTICFFAGFVGMLWAWVRVLFYSRNLQRYSIDFGKQIKEVDKKIVLKETKRDGDPLDARCHILEEVLADANGACRIPELHDLSEYTIQREFAALPPSLLRIIVSFLLIVGIFGTLVGVEGIIRDDGIDITTLPRVLQPSMFAVGGTVLLLWARGFYDYAFRKYLKYLNSFTMEKLLPALPRHFSGIANEGGLGQLQAQNRDFQSEMSKFKESVRALESVCVKLNQEKELLSGKIEKLGAVATGITAMTTRLGENEQLQREISEQHREPLAQIPEMVEDVGAKLSMLEQLKEVTEHIAKVFPQLAGNVEGAGEYVKDVMDVAKEISAFTGEMHGYSEMLRQMCEMRENIVTASESLEKQIEVLTESDQSISEQIGEPARVALGELRALLQVRQDQRIDFDGRLKEYDDEAKGLFLSIENLINDFEGTSCKNLADELGKRTKELGL